METDIRPQDKTAFANAAARIGVYILVRGTNKATLEYIGNKDFVAKPIDCKLKTADAGPLAGLVVDPNVNSAAFSSDRLEKAKKTFKKDPPPSRYTTQTDKKSTFLGCLMLDGKYIHGDYDLKAIVLPGQEFRNLALVTEMFGQEARRGPKFHEVQLAVNGAIGKDMIQHGSDDEYNRHANETIFVFGPKREYEVLQNLTDIQKWYRKEFQGRKTLDHTRKPQVPPPGVKGIQGVISDGKFTPVDVSKLKR